MTRNKRRFNKRDMSHRLVVASIQFHDWLDMCYGSGAADSDGKGQDKNGFLHYWWEPLWDDIVKDIVLGYTLRITSGE